MRKKCWNKWTVLCVIAETAVVPVPPKVFSRPKAGKLPPQEHHEWKNKFPLQSEEKECSITSANLDWIFLHQGRNVLYWHQERGPYKEKSFQKNMASCTCALQVEVRTPTCSLHTFLTEKMCQSYPSCGGQGLGPPFFVQIRSGRWRSGAQFVSYGAEMDRGKAGLNQQGGWEPIFWFLR